MFKSFLLQLRMNENDVTGVVCCDLNGLMLAGMKQVL